METVACSRLLVGIKINNLALYNHLNREIGYSGRDLLGKFGMDKSKKLGVLYAILACTDRRHICQVFENSMGETVEYDFR